VERVDYDKYLRTSRIPHLWCPGCGHGIAMKSIIRAVDHAGWTKEDTVWVSGIGCSGRITGYVDFNTLHTTHGRAIAFATGIKLANPKLNVVVVTGDGDGIAIGGNHLIHAARRNLDITVVLLNNNIYGMTGGQCSPTTPQGAMATTAPYGNIEHPFDIASVVAACGGNYVARGTVYNVNELEKLMRQAFLKHGFSFIEVMSPCPTAFGRRNKLKNSIAMMKDLKERSISVKKAKDLTDDEREDRIVSGVLLDREKVEYTDMYRQLIEQLRGS